MNLSDAEMVLCGIAGMVGLAGLLPFLYTNSGEGARTREQSFIYIAVVVVVIIATIYTGCAIYDMLAN